MAGLATAIRLAAKGYQVRVFEQNSYPGGKLSELRLGAYRFDKGPSLFTMPVFVDELSRLAGKDPAAFAYRRLQDITRYFYPDGTRLKANADPRLFAKELKEVLGEEEQAVLTHLRKSEFHYQTVKPVFLEQALRPSFSFLRKPVLRGIMRLPRLQLFKTMHEANRGHFRNDKTVQLFDRYATYNGSDPYRAPALLNLIAHLEFNSGAYLPEKGMHQITEYLYDLACALGVRFYFEHPVQKITHEKKRVSGLISRDKHFPADLLVANLDVHALYQNLLPDWPKPALLLKQEKSSSAFVFFWGIKKSFPELGLHNILFSGNYREEFQQLFKGSSPYHDPTIYINITSKYCAADAPEGRENWFVMVNAPHNKDGKAIDYAETLRKNVVSKINRMLNTNIEPFIEEEATLDPQSIEAQTSSFGGSLYGNSSNSRFAAFLRHPNRVAGIRGLYLAGGSVHPGGGIPLCMMSAKIVSDLISKKEG